MVPESGYYDMDMVVGMNVDGAQFRTYIDGIRLDVKQNPSYPDRIFSYQAGSGVVFSEPIALPKQIGLNKGKHRLVFELIYNSEVRPIVINFYKRGQYGADYEIDFRTCCANDHATDVKHATLADHNWQFNAESSSPAGNFRWIQMMPDSFGARPYDWIGGAGGAKDIVMDIHIPETGTYKMDIISATSIDGANTEVYLDDHKIGQYNSRDPNYPDSQNCGISDPFSMDLITVMKGTHKLKF